MNFSSIIGIFAAVAVFITGLRLSSENLEIFFDSSSLFIVGGGTFVATAISFQITKLFNLMKVFFRRVFFRKSVSVQSVFKEIISSSEKYRKGESLESISSGINDFFFKECIEVYSQDIVEDEDFFEVMEERANNMLVNYKEDANKIKAISKFPPAFGMMGTTIGMIVLLANLGGENALQMIGPAMGVCLITTLYGVAIANLFFVPFSENLSDEANEIYIKNQLVLQGVELLIKKTNPVVIGLKLNSHLTPKDRIDWKSAL